MLLNKNLTKIASLTSSMNFASELSMRLVCKEICCCLRNLSSKLLRTQVGHLLASEENLRASSSKSTPRKVFHLARTRCPQPTNAA